MPRKKTIRVAFIGCDQYSVEQVGNLLKLEATKAVAIYDKDIKKLEKAGEAFKNIRMYQDIDKMFLKEKINAVVIDSLQSDNGYIESICCKKGIHMFFKNSISENYDTAWAIGENIKASEIITSVDFYGRYNPQLNMVKELLDKDPAGLVSAWWVEEKQGKNEFAKSIIHKSSHMIDTLRFLFSESENEVSIPFEIDEERQKSDSFQSSAILQFNKGVNVSFQTGFYSTNTGATKKALEIFTPRCKIEFEWQGAVKISYGEKIEQFSLNSDNKLSAMSEFIEAVRNNEPERVLSNYFDAMETLKLTLELIKKSRI